MKRFFFLSFIFTIALACLATSGAYHKFYVSLTEIRCFQDSSEIEISMRIFPDDLDRAIEMRTGINPHITTEIEYEKTDEWISEYLGAYFKLWINGKPVPCRYIGKEPDGNAVWCYIEGTMKEHPVRVRVENRILMEAFEDQKNIIQFYYGDYNKGMLLDRIEPDGEIIVKE